MVVDQRQDHLAKVRELLGLAVYPLQVAVDMPFDAWESLTSSLADRRELLRENDELASELRIAQVRLQDFEAMQRENVRFRALLNALDDQSELEMSMAEILAVDLVNRQRFMINRGHRDGVEVGQPLLDANGVVGQVSKVFEYQSEALLITDPAHRVNVTVAESGLRAIAQGTGDNGRLRLLFVTNNDAIEVGDELITSGLGGVFPRGRPVARVVSKEPGQPFAQVLAEPVADLDRDQEVLLVWNVGPEPDDEAELPSLAEAVR
jgi:rod shape-determining protein MreC